MVYRIVYNGRHYKIQRKGSGLILKDISKWYNPKAIWKCIEETIPDWTDMRGCDIYDNSSDKDVEYIWSQSEAENIIQQIIAEIHYLKTKDNWKTIKVIDDNVKLKRPLP